MQTIAFISQKGGCGKTTLALHVAAEFWRARKAAVVLDLDPQQSATQWHTVRSVDDDPDKSAVVPVSLESLSKVMARCREAGVHTVICDTGAFDGETAREVASRADLILAPCQPSITDLRSMTRTASILKSLNKPAFAVLSLVPPYPGPAENAEAALRAMGLDCCPVRISRRVDFMKCQVDGLVSYEIEPNGKAAAEIDALFAWVTTQLERGHASKAS